MSKTTDCNFPHIQYELNKSPVIWGKAHGEEFRQEIKELSQIRRDLMIQKNPALKSHLDELAQLQAQHTQANYPELYKELEGIIKGSDSSLTDIIILNNYTDFRDINLTDQGCTSVGLKKEENISGQTWDMHSSAKNYVCTIELPGQWIVYSLVGCLGMMGANKHSLFIGVNNINTQKAKAGVIWPAMVRKILQAGQIHEAKDSLLNASPTSGHNYILSNGKTWENWEISPQFQQRSHKIDEEEENKAIFHTNHCLNEEAKKQEEAISRNSTSFDRYKVMEEKIDSLVNGQNLIDALQSHDNYPKSLCGHYQSGAQDPSITCGGGVFNHQTKEFFVWRGCKLEDSNYCERTHKL